MKIVADQNIPFVKHYFESYGKLILKPGRLITAEDVKDADLLIVRSITPVNEKLLKNARVKYVGSITAGCDHLDIDWLTNAGVEWSLATGFNAPPVADYVVSVIAALQKKNELNNQIRAAIIGVGNVGKLVVHRLQQLNFSVLQCDPFRANNETNFISTSLDEVEDVDLISLHVPLTKSGLHPTYHFINHQFLAKQKPNCVLLNTSRGSVIDTEALQTDGKHLKWCFDVWEHEPNINLTILSNAMIASPHVAGYSIQSKIRGIDMIYNDLCAKKIIEPHKQAQVTLPKQFLTYNDVQRTWQDVVLQVFNPITMTKLMKNTLQENNNISFLFDEIRHQFNYRHEFHFTHVSGSVADADKLMLTKLGFICD